MYDFLLFERVAAQRTCAAGKHLPQVVDLASQLVRTLGLILQTRHGTSLRV